MRRAVGSAIVLVAVLAVALFAVPLGFAVSRLYRAEAVGRLTGEAVRAAVRVERADGRAAGSLPAPRDGEVRLGLYDAAGRLLAGDGPPASAAAATVGRDGGEEQELSGGDLAVAVPVERDGRTGPAVVRAALPYDRVLARTWTTFGGMAVLAVAVIAFAALLARRRAVRIAAPLEELTRAAQALGGGDFAVRAAASRLLEAEQAGAALEATARRLGALLERERSLAADVSHQVRTPLTALRLGLERASLDPAADPAETLRAALERVDRVEATVDELVARVRDTFAPVRPLAVPELVEQAAAGRWRELARAADRPLEITAQPPLPPALATPAVVHQVLDVLVTNALRHGAGPVTVTVRAATGGVAVDVGDGGEGFDAAALDAAFRRGDPRARGSGIGLALARDLAESLGGRLSVTRAGPEPVVTLLLPAAPAVPAAPAAGPGAYSARG